MHLDDTRLNWRDSMILRKQGVDAYLDQYRQGTKPAVSVKQIAGLLAVTAICALLGALSYMTTLATADAARAHVLEKQLIDCMNARATWSYPNNTGRGYGKTMVVCRGVEEFQL